MKAFWIASSLVLIAMLSVSSGVALAATNMIPVTHNGKTFNVNATLDSGTIRNMTIDENASSLVIGLYQSTIKNGTLTIDLPRALIDSKLGSTTDNSFMFMSDGIETNYTELQTNDQERDISANIPIGTSKIEIIGTQVTPEFPSWALMVIIPLAFGIATVVGKRSKSF